MHKLIAAALMVAFVSACATIVPPSATHKITDEEWNFVCAEVSARYPTVDCRVIPQPTVVVSKIVPSLPIPGLLGIFFHEEEYVFVNANLTPELQRVVVVHETVHYILNYVFGKKIDSCTHEHVARQIHHKYEGTPYDDSWRFNYGCMEPARSRR